jgi:hypothetical protein
MKMTCPECNHVVSSYSQNCMNCGLPTKMIEIANGDCYNCNGTGKVGPSGYSGSNCFTCGGSGRTKIFKLKEK